MELRRPLIRVLYVAVTVMLLGSWLSCEMADAQDEPGDAASPDAVADSQLDSLLEMLDARRQLAGEGGYRWSFKTERFSIGQPDLKDYQASLEKRAANPLAGAIKDRNERFEGEIAWQPSTHRFHFSASFVQKWIGGAAKYLGEREQIAFDGDSYWDIEIVRPGKELPQEDFTKVRDPSVDWKPAGTIAREPPPGGRIEHLVGESGFAFRPGYLALPYGQDWGKSVDAAGFLRELIRDGRPLTVQEAGETVTVSFVTQLTRNGREYRGTMQLTFNAGQLGAIERITYTSDGPGGKKLRHADYSIRNAEIVPGVWFPKEIIWGDWMNPLVIRVQISDVQKVESFRTADFQVEFPAETTITDHRSKTVFVAAEDMWDEARATQEYARTYLGDFSATSGGTGLGKSVLFWIAIGAATLLALVGLSYFARSRTARLLILASVSSSAALAGESSTAPALKWSDRGWVLQSQADGRELVVTQCGYRVTCLTLTAFKRDYDPGQLARQLRPTTQGNSLRQIVETLQGFRIGSQVRSSVSWQELYGKLPEGGVAVVAIPNHRIVGGHFVGVIRDRHGKVLVLDPPFSVKELKPVSNDRYTTKELVVAFLSETESDKSTTCQPTELKFPERVEVAPDPAKWSKTVTAQFPISNRSAVPVWLEPIKPPCGCIKILNQPALLMPGDSGLVEFEIHPPAWGAGLRRKSIPLSFVRQFQASVVLEGEFIKPSAAEPNPTTGIGNVKVPIEWGDETFQTQVRFPIDQVPEGSRVTVTTGDNWCSATIDTEEQSIVAAIAIPAAQLQRIRAGETLVSQMEFSGAALYATYGVHIAQDMGALVIANRLVKPDAIRFQFSGSLALPSAGDWKCEASSTLASMRSCEWSIAANGNWRLTGELTEPTSRPAPVSLQFTHPEYLPVSTSCVLLP